MIEEKTICICGGGGLGSVIAGIAASGGYRVNILTRRPEKWGEEMTVIDPAGKIFVGKLNKVSDKAGDVIPESDIIFFCLPGTAFYDEFIKIKPYVTDSAVVGSVFSSTGFFITGIDVLGEGARLFGFQRVPYISRLKDYGHSAYLLGYKKSLNIAYWNVSDASRYTMLFEDMLHTRIVGLNHPLEAMLTNSNPILHPVRLYTLFKDFNPEHPFVAPPLFYEDWTDESSEILIACDNEFQSLVKSIGIKESVIPSLLEYYESTDACSLTRKIRSIVAFKGIYAPTKPVSGGMYVPDYDNRYFQEDIPLGLMLIKYMAQINHIPTPMIDMILRWYEGLAGKNLLSGSEIAESEDTAAIRCLNSRIIKKLISTFDV